VHQELNPTLPTATTNSTNSHKEAGKNAFPNAERSKSKHFSKPFSMECPSQRIPYFPEMLRKLLLTPLHRALCASPKSLPPLSIAPYI
jgi:hypothetical protein